MKTYSFEFIPNKKNKEELISRTLDGKLVFMHKKHKIKPYKSYKCIIQREYKTYLIVDIAPSLFRQFLNFILPKKNN